MNLQHSSMGSMGKIWINCQDRYDEFVNRACEYLGLECEQVRARLINGETVQWPGALSAEIRDLDSVTELKLSELPECDTWDENSLLEEEEQY